MRLSWVSATSGMFHVELAVFPECRTKLTIWSCPGIWGAMNSLGGGGEESPRLVNTANALTFSLMVLTCAFSSVVVKRVGVRATLVIGAAGYAPFAAGLYCNNRYQTEWFLLLGAALCGLGAGIAMIGLSSPSST